MIYLTGDTHIPIDIRKLNSKNFSVNNIMTKNDYLIVTGDFGAIWTRRDKTELFWLNWLNEKNFTTLFVDGNHENHDRLFSGIISPEVSGNDEYVIEEKFGGLVGHIVGYSIYHLRRGEVYTIGNKKFFVMGGANSIDKNLRKPGFTWWGTEEPNVKEFNYALDNLQKHQNKVDYILGHTGPGTIIKKYIDKYWKEGSVERFFDHIINEVYFKDFYFGHTHENIDTGKYHFLYNRVVKLL